MSVESLQALLVQITALKRFSRVGRFSREWVITRFDAEIVRRKGYDDRIAKLPCQSSNGMYLDGYIPFGWFVVLFDSVRYRQRRTGEIIPVISFDSVETRAMLSIVKEH